MAIGWAVLAELPDGELTRLSNEQIDAYIRKQRRG
jgi:vacuolar-type H+-ATPase subunit B/Vma2